MKRSEGASPGFPHLASKSVAVGTAVAAGILRRSAPSHETHLRILVRLDPTGHVRLGIRVDIVDHMLVAHGFEVIECGHPCRILLVNATRLQREARFARIEAFEEVHEARGAVPTLPRELRDVRHASQQLTKQGPRRHNRSIGSPEAVGLDVRQFKYRLKRMLGLGRCLEVAQRI